MPRGETSLDHPSECNARAAMRCLRALAGPHANTRSQQVSFQDCGTDVVFAIRRMRIDSVIVGCSGNDLGTQFAEAGADYVWQK